MSSSRLQTTCTGPSTCCATRVAMMMPSRSRRRPNPPPSRWLWTTTLSTGRPVTCAAAWRARPATCVPTQTSQDIRAHMHRAVHRLHGGMGEDRHAVDGFDAARTPGLGVGDITALMRHQRLAAGHGGVDATLELGCCRGRHSPPDPR